MPDAPPLYRMLKRLLPPVLNRYLRVTIEGLDNIPGDGPAILACNHLSFIDSVILPLNVPRPVYFLGKAEYFESWRTRWFVTSVGCVPVHRTGGRKGQEGLEAGMRILEDGDVLGVYPEGTRSPDGRLYRGKTGPVRMAMAVGAPVVPCAVEGTVRAMPVGARVPRPVPVTVRYGQPLDFSGDRGREGDSLVVRTATDRLMEEIRALSGQEYVDEYAAHVKMRQRRADRPVERSGGQENDGPGDARRAVG